MGWLQKIIFGNKGKESSQEDQPYPNKVNYNNLKEDPQES